MIFLEINGTRYDVDTNPDEPLLWVIRSLLKLTGTKYGCGTGSCGCCTVLVDGRAERSCVLPVGRVQGRRITTIEGLPEDHPVLKAWKEEQVPQCGYCQSGQIMQAVSFLSENPAPSVEEITKAMARNLCRCGTYPRVLKAMRKAAKQEKEP